MKGLSRGNRILSFLMASLLLCLCIVHASAEEESDAVFCMTEAELTSTFSSTVFFGESTTAHLARRGGVLDTPALRRLVWRDESGTRMLDRRLLSTTVLYEDAKGNVSRVSVADALARERPARIVLSFGLNGLRAHAKDPARFLSAYRFVLDGIRAASPDTEILLQSVYPVGENTVFSADVETLNQEIRTLNDALAAACREWGDVRFIDTASCLRDASGALRPDFDVGDGIHLTNEAYKELLSRLSALA